MRRTSLLLLAAFLFISCVPLVCAGDVDLLDLPANVAAYFGIDTFSAGILVSGVIMIFGVIIVGFTVRKSQAATYAILATTFVLMGFTVALGWLPVWTMVIVVLVIALMYAKELPGIFGGK
jgi:hypothetical protein